MSLVQVSSAEVEAIVFAGLNHIGATRMVNLNKAIEEATSYTKLTWFGRKLLQRTREQAIAFLKRPSDNMFGWATYQYITEVMYKQSEDRLKVLGNMAKSSVDGTLWLDSDDHKLLRSYAGKAIENEGSDL